jgi:hypothetical protein
MRKRLNEPVLFLQSFSVENPELLYVAPGVPENYNYAAGAIN